MEGFADVDGTKIIVFYPQNGVSFIQEQQMLTQKGKILLYLPLMAILILLKQMLKSF